MFREKATTQLAAYLIKKAGGRCNRLVLLKMLYFADRKMLLECSRPITFDSWISMENGPVLSKTYDLLKQNAPQGYMSDHIKGTRYEVVLKRDPGDSDLSDRAILYADEAFGRFWGKTWEEAADLAHDLFAEWQDPGKSMIPIRVEDVLRVNGKLDEEHLAEVRENNQLNELFGRLTNAV